MYQNARKKIIHIHGAIENNDIIFGVEDKARIEEEYIFLKKSVNPNFCTLDIKDILHNKTDNIIFFGYSLGITDYTYFQKNFRDISSNLSVKEIAIYFYGMTSYYDIFKRIDEMSSHSISGIKQRNNLVFIDLKDDSC